MTTLLDLPCELVSAVLASLDSLQDLVNAICTCRHIYAAFMERPSAAGSIVQSFFSPDTLALAVAAECVATALPAPRTAASVRDFVDGLARPDGRLLAMQLKSMPLRSLYSMMDTEDAITDLAFDFAERAWEQFYFERPRDVGLSPAEALRFVRAFYRTEILVRAFRFGWTEDDHEHTQQATLWLVMSFAQFEIEQIACVHDYMEKKLLISCLRVFIEDVELGAMEVDFVSPDDNRWKQRWISQGASFMGKLSRASMSGKGTLLRSAFHKDSLSVYRVLDGVSEMYRQHRSVAATGPRDTIDTDSGPPSAFDYANMDLLMVEGESAHGQVQPVLATMAEEDSGLRERAYVLWDMERMKDWDLWDQIEISPRAATITPTIPQYEVMWQLWDRQRANWAGRNSSRWFVTPTAVEMATLKAAFCPWGDEVLGSDDLGELAGEWVDV